MIGATENRDRSDEETPA